MTLVHDPRVCQPPSPPQDLDKSRLIIGTGKYETYEQNARALEASGAAILYMSTFSEEGVMDVKSAACDMLLANRVEQRMGGQKIEQIVSRITTTTMQFPWLVCAAGDQVLGYVYAGKHRSRSAYQWSVDVTVYVHVDARRRGIARALYTVLFKLLAAQGFYNAYAGIALPNPGSVAVHEAMGMVPIGVYKQVGYKLGAWHDVGWWQKRL